MAISAQQQNENPAEARRATLEQFAQLHPEKQTAFLQKTFDQPELHANPELLHAAMKDTVQQHLQPHRSPALILEAMLQLSPQLVPSSPEQEHAKHAELAASVSTAQAEVKLALMRGESVESIKAKAVSSENTVQAGVVTSVAQEHQQEQKLAEMAVNREQDQKYRVEQGLAEPQANPLAAALAKHAGAASEFAASLGGHKQDYNQQAAPQTVASVIQPDQGAARG